MAGTTHSTVSRVLSNHPKISEATKKRVLEVVNKHDFQLNPYAQGIRGRKDAFIAVLSRYINGDFFAKILEGINDGALRSGHHLMCSFAHDEPDFLDTWKNLLRRGALLNGIIVIAPPMNFFNQATPSPTIPTTLCAAACDKKGNPWFKVDSVVFDNRSMMSTILNELEMAGHKKIVHLAGTPDNYDAVERRHAFEQELKNHKRLSGSVIQGALLGAENADLLRNWRRATATWPDAFVCVNDSSAEAVDILIKGTKGINWKNCSVTGWDDSPAAAFNGYSSVRPPLYQMGATACEQVLKRANTVSTPKQKAVLPTEWIPRASTTSFRAANGR